jgi:hypothetical protein
MTTNNEPAIEEMMRDAEMADEPGDMKAGKVISATADMTMSTAELQSAGYVYVYDNRTANRSVVNRNMLQQQLEKRRADGSFAFSTRQPEGVEPIVGTLKCFLHEDDSNRERYDRMGLVRCIKSDFLNEMDRENHLRRRHPKAYATLENERTRGERDAERLERIALTETIKNMAQANEKGGKNG